MYSSSLEDIQDFAFDLFFIFVKLIDTCLQTCSKCEHGSQHCSEKCPDPSKYFECHSSCIEPTGKNNIKCNGNAECTKSCEENCERLWPGMCKYLILK